MARRGRPKTGTPGWKLARMTVAQFAYLEARKAGAKHEAALDAGAEAARAAFLGSKMSRSDVRRALAFLMPTGYEKVLVPRQMAKEDAQAELDIRNALLPADAKPFTTISNSYTIRLTSRPAIPRVNAKRPTKKSRAPNSQWN